jgi:hypothetical protein
MELQRRDFIVTAGGAAFAAVVSPAHADLLYRSIVVGVLSLMRSAYMRLIPGIY